MIDHFAESHPDKYQAHRHGFNILLYRPSSQVVSNVLRHHSCTQCPKTDPIR